MALADNGERGRRANTISQQMVEGHVQAAGLLVLMSLITLREQHGRARMRWSNGHLRLLMGGAGRTSPGYFALEYS